MVLDSFILNRFLAINLKSCYHLFFFMRTFGMLLKLRPLSFGSCPELGFLHPLALYNCIFQIFILLIPDKQSFCICQVLTKAMNLLCNQACYLNKVSTFLFHANFTIRHFCLKIDIELTRIHSGQGSSGRFYISKLLSIQLINLFRQA